VGVIKKSDVEKFIGACRGTFILDGNDLQINVTYILLSNNTINFISL